MTHPPVDRARRNQVAMWLANCHYVGSKMKVLDPWEKSPSVEYSRFFDVVWVTIQRLVPSAYPPHDLISQQCTQVVPEFCDSFERFVTWLRHCLRDMEIHECDERFIVVGQRIYDPHADPAARVAVPDPDPEAVVVERPRALEEEGGWGRRGQENRFFLGQAPSLAQRALAYSGDLDLPPEGRAAP